MKTFILLLLLAASLCGFGQQNSHESSAYDPLHCSHSPILVYKNGFAIELIGNKYRFKDHSGKILPGLFDEARDFVNGLAAVRQNDLWGFIDADGKIIIPIKYRIVYDFSEVNTIVYLDNKWYIISKTDNVVASPDIDAAWGFKNGVSRVTKRKVNGSMYLTGNISWENTLSESSPKNQLARNTRTLASCPSNIDFELGNFTNWTCYTGMTDTIRQTNTITVTPSGPVANRHTIISQGSAVDPYGLFPTRPPDGSGFAVKLGNNVVGRQAERISYVVNVPTDATDYSITFQYAVVFQDPGHTPWSQPRFLAKMFDPITGTYLDCATFEYIATSNLPGFLNSPVTGNVRYKPWSSVFINLSEYGGRSLVLEFTTADCTRGQHWGYAYIDVGNCSRTASIAAECPPPHRTTLTGPGGFEFYNWWDSSFTTIIGTGENFLLNPGPVSATKYWVEVIPFNGYGCRDTLGVSIAPNYPEAKAGPDVSVCSNASATIGMAAVPGFSYSWSPTNYLSNAASSNPTATPPQATTYILTVTNDSTGCTATDTVVVALNPKPVAAFNANQPSQCFATNNFTLTNTSSISSGSMLYAWDFGDGTTSSLRDPVHNYTITGAYTIKLVVTSNNGCKDSISKSVTVLANPVSDFSMNSTSQCLQGNNFSFISNNLPGQTISVYAWSFGDGGTSSLQNPSHVFATAGSYNVKLVITNNQGCLDSITKPITVFATPTVSISYANATICKGQTIQLHATGGSAYAWSPAQGLSCTSCADPVVSVDTASVFMVKGTDVNNCFAFDTVRIQVAQPFKLTVPTDTICSTGSNRLSANGAHSYQWSPAAGLSSTTISNPVASPLTTTQYKVVGYDSLGCFRDSAYVVILVEQRPKVELGPDLSLTTGTTYTLQPVIANGPVTKWTWSPVTNLSCGNCPAPVASIKGDITYSLTVTNRYGCVARDVINIKTFCLSAQIFIPNAFTPDGNGDNDILMVRGKGVTMVKSFRIFNRWGELVFEKTHFPPNTPAYGWDGKIKGVVGEPAVYVYTAEVVCENGSIYTYKGNTTILK